MKVRVYTANNMQEAVALVKNDLGRDAVILHTRRFRKGGILGFGAREMVEVTAALDTAPTPAPEKRQAPVVMPARQNDDEAKVAALQLELSTMRRLMEQVLSQMPRREKRQSPLYELLLHNGVDPTIAENLLQGLPEEEALAAGNPGIVRQLLRERITNHLNRVEGVHAPETGCKTVAFIGPTGVGKTTTIAKLAASFALTGGHRVALITADTYRISAVEQLKTYADIIGIPIDVVYTPDELKAALYRHRDKRLVFIDTAGRSPHNHYQLAELQALLAVDPYIETHLVMSATTKYADALDTVNCFSACSPQKFLFTKLDETSNLGTIFNLFYQFPTTFSYVTTGQNVPDDIELANPAKLADMLMRD